MQNLFTSKGIIHQTVCTYTHQQNGTIERKHRHLLNVARILKIQSGVPDKFDKFWGECVLTVCHLINVTPSSVLKFVSPHEKLYGSPLNLSYLHVFGS